MPHRWNDHEHRWGERFRVNVPVNVAATTFAKVNGRLRNISLSGALISADVNLPLNSLIEVSFVSPAPTRIGVLLNAHITRKLGEDVGIEWCEFAPNAVKDLLRSTASVISASKSGSGAKGTILPVASRPDCHVVDDVSYAGRSPR